MKDQLRMKSRRLVIMYCISGVYNFGTHVDFYPTYSVSLNASKRVRSAD